jgi:hypothetical protein
MVEWQDPVAALRLWIVDGVLSAPDSPDTEALLAAASSQGLEGLLASALRETASRPTALVTRAVSLERTTLVRVVRHLDLAARIHTLLLEHGQRTLPLKGAAVAERLYASPAHRPMSDVDLLVLDDWVACARLLEARGFVRLEAGDHAVPFRDPESGLVVELHVAPVSCPGFFPLDAEGLWSRNRPGPGQIPRLPGAEDLLVHLALHATFQHGLGLTLVQYLDLRRLLEREDLDVERLRQIAAAARASTAVAVALRAAEIVIGARVPAALAAVLDGHIPPGLARWLAARSAHPLALLSPSPPPVARMRWLIAEGRRLELLRRTLLAHPPGERPHAFQQASRATLRALRLLGRLGR